MMRTFVVVEPEVAGQRAFELGAAGEVVPAER
jgi:hypothetical protein